VQGPKGPVWRARGRSGQRGAWRASSATRLRHIGDLFDTY